MARDRIARILLDATRSGTKTRRARALEKTRMEKNRPTDRPTETTDRPTDRVVESELVDAARSNKVRAWADVSMICIDLTDSSYG
jgi:hypothetical protein